MAQAPEALLASARVRSCSRRRIYKKPQAQDCMVDPSKRFWPACCSRRKHDSVVASVCRMFQLPLWRVLVGLGHLVEHPLHISRGEIRLLVHPVLKHLSAFEPLLHPVAWQLDSR